MLAGLVLVTATPAQAAVVTTDVPADTIVNLTSANFVGGNTTPWVPAGPITYPFDTTIVPAGVGEGSVASGFTLSPAAAGCTRLINAITYDFTVGTADGGTGTETTLGVAVGIPAQFVGSILDYTGDGTAESYAAPGEPSPIASVALQSGDSNPFPSGRLTLTLATPAAASGTVIVPVEFTTQEDQPIDVTVNDFTVSVTDTCPDAVVAAAPTLASTGFDATPLVGGALGALLIGAAFVGFGARRRASAHA